MDSPKVGSATVTAFMMDNEQEHHLLAEALHESEQHLAMTKFELSRCQAEKENLQKLLTKERRRHKAVQDELDNVKLRSHHLLLCQGDELAQSVVSLSRLAGGLGKLYEELQKAADKFSEPDDCVNEERRSNVTSMSASSICYDASDTLGDSGIDATSTDTKEGKVDSDIETTIEKEERDVKTSESCSSSTGDCGNDYDVGSLRGSDGVAVSEGITSGSDNNRSSIHKQTKSCEQEQRQFGSSVGSAFAPIRNRKEQMAPRVCSDRDIMTIPQTGPDLSSLDELPVNKQVDELNNLVTLIISALRKVKQGVTASHMKKQARLRSLEATLDEVHSAHQKELAALRASVDCSDKVQHQMALKMRLLQTELAGMRDQLSSEEESLMGLRELLQQRTQKLEQLQDQYMYIQRLKQEVDHLTRLSQQKESENAIIAETLESTMVRLKEVEGQEAGCSTEDFEVNYIRKNLGLRKEVSHLKQRVLQVQEDATAVVDKANRRMRTLETNWRQAESELHRLDQLLEQILEVLRKHTETIKDWDDAAIIMHEITDTRNTSSDSID